jgi:hypothetical protein
VTGVLLTRRSLSLEVNRWPEPPTDARPPAHACSPQQTGSSQPASTPTAAVPAVSCRPAALDVHSCRARLSTLRRPPSRVRLPCRRRLCRPPPPRRQSSDATARRASPSSRVPTDPPIRSPIPVSLNARERATHRAPTAWLAGHGRLTPALPFRLPLSAGVVGPVLASASSQPLRFFGCRPFRSFWNGPPFHASGRLFFLLSLGRTLAKADSSNSGEVSSDLTAQRPPDFPVSSQPTEEPRECRWPSSAVPGADSTDVSPLSRLHRCQACLERSGHHGPRPRAFGLARRVARPGRSLPAIVVAATLLPRRAGDRLAVAHELVLDARPDATYLPFAAERWSVGRLPLPPNELRTVSGRPAAGGVGRASGSCLRRPRRNPGRWTTLARSAHLVRLEPGSQSRTTAIAPGPADESAPERRRPAAGRLDVLGRRGHWRSRPGDDARHAVALTLDQGRLTISGRDAISLEAVVSPGEHRSQHAACPPRAGRRRR